MSPRNRNASFPSGRTWLHSSRLARKQRGLVMASSLVLVLVSAACLFTFSLSTPKAYAAGGTGAALPYVEMEAHNATTTGTILGPSYALGNVASDAVDRQAVQLTSGKS